MVTKRLSPKTANTTCPASGGRGPAPSSSPASRYGAKFTAIFLNGPDEESERSCADANIRTAGINRVATSRLCQSRRQLDERMVSIEALLSSAKTGCRKLRVVTMRLRICGVSKDGGRDC